MKVAYIITLPDLGGAQSHVYELMKGIRADYHVTPVLITGKKGWLTEQAEKLQIEMHIVPDMIRAISPLHDWKAEREIKRLLREIKPDLVHCHSSKAGILGRWAAKRCGIPAVFTAHGWAFTDGIPEKKRQVYRLIERMAGQWCKKIICVSDYDRNLALREIPSLADKLVTVHNCIPDTEYRKDWNKFDSSKPLQIVTVARFSPQKKNKEILGKLAKALQQGLSLHVTFIGDGPQFNDVKAYAKQIGVEKNATFLGARSDVEQLLPKYDLFLLLSNWEGFPISIIEAMRAGLPVMASDVGGVHESVQDGVNGWLILRDDSKLLEILHALCQQKIDVRKMGLAARRSYVQNFTIDNMVDEIVQNVYGEMLKPNRNSGGVLSLKEIFGLANSLSQRGVIYA